MTDQDRRLQKTYAALMDEVRARIDVIGLSVRGGLGVQAPFAREFCYLQLRMLCELIAIACLVAHGDMEFLQSHKIGRSHSADEILGRMAQLRPHFYPVPIKQTGPTKKGIEPIKPSPLPRDDLIRLYGLTHKFVHRGTLKKLLSSDQTIDPKFDTSEVASWTQKIADLLAIHAIMIDGDRLFLVMLKNINDHDRVQIATTSRISGPSVLELWGEPLRP